MNFHIYKLEILFRIRMLFTDISQSRFVIESAVLSKAND